MAESLAFYALNTSVMGDTVGYRGERPSKDSLSQRRENHGSDEEAAGGSVFAGSVK